MVPSQNSLVLKISGLRQYKTMTLRNPKQFVSTMHTSLGEEGGKIEPGGGRGDLADFWPKEQKLVPT